MLSRSEFIEAVKARNFKKFVQRLKQISQFNPFEPATKLHFKRIKSNFSMNTTNYANSYGKDSSAKANLIDSLIADFVLV